MSDKIPYVQMKLVYEQMVQNLFSFESKSLHGWEMKDFLEIHEQEIVAQAEEETYDIAFEAPPTLQ